MNKAFVKRYDTIKTPQGFGFAFYCDLCDKKYKTGEYLTDSYMEAFYQAWEAAMLQFNMCHKCGKWICDEHYNENVMECIECAPLPDRNINIRKANIPSTKVCSRCGAVFERENCYCPICGKETG